MADFKNNCQSIINYLLGIFDIFVSSLKTGYQNTSLFIEYYYKFFIRNILFYLFPAESISIFNIKPPRIRKFNLLDLYSSNDTDNPSRYYITKFHDIKYDNGSFYRCGHFYHTSYYFCSGLKKENSKLKEIQSIDIRFKSDQSAQSDQSNQSKSKPDITISRSDNFSILSKISKNTTDCCKDKSRPKLLDDIIDNMSNDSNIIILIYYYIQTYLKDYRIISNIRIGYIPEPNTDSDSDSESDFEDFDYIDLDIEALGLSESDKILKTKLKPTKPKCK